MMPVIAIIFAHYLLDFPLQSDYLAKTKRSDWYSMLAHCVIYGLGMWLTFYLLGLETAWTAMVLVGSHVVIDTWKATRQTSKAWHLWLDQALHITIALALWWLVK